MTIVSVAEQPAEVLVAALRGLFAEYGEFLRANVASRCFDYERFQGEISELPANYQGSGGDVLLAREGDLAAGCIAFRRLPEGQGLDVCELKRLYVAPRCRRGGLGRDLITAALERAAARGYRQACLDTEPIVMGGAHRLYRELGFEPDPGRRSDDGLVYLRRELGAAAGQG